jgi:hypothetical protein
MNPVNNLYFKENTVTSTKINIQKETVPEINYDLTTLNPIDTEKLNQELKIKKIHLNLVKHACTKLKISDRVHFKLKDLMAVATFSLLYKNTENKNLLDSIFNYFTKKNIAQELKNPCSNECQLILKELECIHNQEKSDHECFELIDNLKILQKYGEPFLELNMGELVIDNSIEFTYNDFKENEVNLEDLLILYTFGNDLCGISYGDENKVTNSDDNTISKSHANAQTEAKKKIKNFTRLTNKIYNLTPEQSKAMLMIKKVIENQNAIENLSDHFINAFTKSPKKQINDNYILNKYDALFIFKQSIIFFSRC